MPINQKTNNDTRKQSVPEVLNQSFDQSFQVLVNENLVYNPVSGDLDRMVQPGNEIPTSGNNPIVKLYTNASGELVKVEKIIGATTYTKTSDVADQVVTSTVTYSAWS